MATTTSSVELTTRREVNLGSRSLTAAAESDDEDTLVSSARGVTVARAQGGADKAAAVDTSGVDRFFDSHTKLNYGQKSLGLS